MMVACVLRLNIRNLFLDDKWDLGSSKIARDKDHAVFF